MSKNIPHPFEEIVKLIDKQSSVEEVIDYFVDFFTKFEFEDISINDNIKTSCFNRIQNYILVVEKYNYKEKMDYYLSKIESIVFKQEGYNLRKEIVSLYFNHKKLSEKWNILDKLSKEESIDIIFDLISDGPFLDKILSRKFELKNYLNETRLGKHKLNLLEKSLVMFLGSLYPHYKTKRKLFNYIYIHFKEIDIDPIAVKENSYITRFISKNFFELPSDIQEKLNLNEYETQVNKKTFKFNTEKTVVLNVMLFSAENLMKYGTFFAAKGGRGNTIKDFVKSFSEFEFTKEILLYFIESKQSKAKVPSSKQFWAEIFSEILNQSISQKNHNPKLISRLKI